jgi:hypothetical protein
LTHWRQSQAPSRFKFTGKRPEPDSEFCMQCPLALLPCKTCGRLTLSLSRRRINFGSGPQRSGDSISGLTRSRLGWAANLNLRVAALQRIVRAPVRRSDTALLLGNVYQFQASQPGRQAAMLELISRVIARWRKK